MARPYLPYCETPEPLRLSDLCAQILRGDYDTGLGMLLLAITHRWWKRPKKDVIVN